MSRLRLPLAVSAVLLAACAAPSDIPAQRPEDFAGAGNRAVAPVDAEAFVVAGAPSAGSWCAAARYAEGRLGRADTARIARVGEIPSAGVSVGGRTVAGPGVLYTTGDPGAFAAIAQAPAEARPVSAGLADCA